jgi:hypothetical protein
MSNVAGQTVVRLRDFVGADEAGRQLSGALNSVAVELADGLRNWTGKAKTLARATDGFVRSSPWRAAAAVALAGVAAGVLVSRGVRRARSRAAPADDASDVASELSGG